MIVTENKPLIQLCEILQGYAKVFLVGCGECATTCKTGGKDELEKFKKELEKMGKEILGMCVPKAPCVVLQTKRELEVYKEKISGADALLVFACGLGVQAVRELFPQDGLIVLPACNTLFGAVIDKKGNFYEKCSLCGECVLELTGGVCPVTVCSKGLLNGPCGGMNKGKCEVDTERDCAWVLIYRELEKQNKLDQLKKTNPARDYKKHAKPQRLILTR
ncbi:MAG: methylenetetrahydrofolate reductase C-terminal domain-containing protein [Candidatus Omnitrophota bacterium]|nr:methylenetetrahydrofolate reductase C-terminal domain-containing protein [Candidatus Omnitrophota bacterium]